MTNYEYHVAKNPSHEHLTRLLNEGAARGGWELVTAYAHGWGLTYSHFAVLRRAVPVPGLDVPESSGVLGYDPTAIRALCVLGEIRDRMQPDDVAKMQTALGVPS